MNANPSPAPSVPFSIQKLVELTDEGRPHLAQEASDEVNQLTTRSELEKILATSNSEINEAMQEHNDAGGSLDSYENMQVEDLHFELYEKILVAQAKRKAALDALSRLKN